MSILRKLQNFLGKPALEAKQLTPYTLYQGRRIQYITEFQDGYALALFAKDDGDEFLNDNLYVAVVDTNYEILMSTSYHSFGDWCNGYLIAFNYSYTHDAHVVLLDSNLKEIPNIRYKWISNNNNYFEVCKKVESNELNGLLDKNLELILPEVYSSIKAISKSRFFCQGEQNIVFDALTKQTFEVNDVSWLGKEEENSWYKFTNSNNQFGYFDNNFNVIIQPKYCSLGDFGKNGFAPFERDGIISVIDRTGKEFIR